MKISLGSVLSPVHLKPILKAIYMQSNTLTCYERTKDIIRQTCAYTRNFKRFPRVIVIRTTTKIVPVHSTPADCMKMQFPILNQCWKKKTGHVVRQHPFRGSGWKVQELSSLRFMTPQQLACSMQYLDHTSVGTDFMNVSTVWWPNAKYDGLSFE